MVHAYESVNFVYFATPVVPPLRLFYSARNVDKTNFLKQCATCCSFHALYYTSISSPYRCPHCEYKSPWIQKWQAHIDAKHPEHGEQKFFCDHCPKSFIFEGSLRRHMEKVRSKLNKPKKRKMQLPCDYCEKMLKSYHLAKVHYRNHHPNRPIIAPG